MALVALAMVGTFGVMTLKDRVAVPSSAADTPPGQSNRGEAVYVFASFYAGAYGADLSVKQGEPSPADMPPMCDVSFPYKAEWSGSQGIKAGEAQPNLIHIFLTKELSAGTRLGNFGPPISCAGGYIYRAEVLN